MHRVRLARARLAIGDEAGVVPGQERCHERRRARVVHLRLRRLPRVEEEVVVMEEEEVGRR